MIYTSTAIQFEQEICQSAESCLKQLIENFNKSENFEKHWNQSSQYTEQMMLVSSNVACKQDQERLKQFT